MRAPDWLIARPIAHRGLHDRARGVIENMPGAVDAAIAGNFAIEVDIQASADNEAMVFHDDDLDRLTTCHGPLAARTADELKAIRFRDTTERMMSLSDLCARVAGRVPLVIEIKSRFSGDHRLLQRMAEILCRYDGPAAAMSFDPNLVQALRSILPSRPRGIVAERCPDEADWNSLTPAQRRSMRGLRHAFRSQPHFVAFAVDQLPAPAPWIARHLFFCPLLAWTVRSPAQRTHARAHADQIIFEGFVPPD
ncbi:MAG: glycerophosphodiester phosphodiesterase [Alphaproteobacteria bacterium]|nr:glycerophosphodiester phosphodiesterase [Alphaproteobacteria bacterium]